MAHCSPSLGPGRGWRGTCSLSQDGLEITPLTFGFERHFWKEFFLLRFY